jgi:putative hemolysin
MKVDVPSNGSTSFEQLIPNVIRRWGLTRAAMAVTGLGAFEQLVERGRARAAGGPIVPAVLAEAGIAWRLTNPDALEIPASGPLIVVANHAFGVADAGVLHTLTRMHRPDCRTVSNYVLRYVPELVDELFFVDPIVDAVRARENAPAMRQMVRHLRGGGAVAMFPAGAMMRWLPRERRFSDPPWSTTLGALVRLSGATVLPLYFHGRNRLRFNLLNAVSRDAGLAIMLAEFIARQGKEVVLTAGRPIAYESLHGLDDAGITATARDATFALA